MNRGEYTDAVLSQLRRVTGDERESIRADLDAHMEDHICALRDLGYDEQLAEERTLALMGDPAEVGKELSKIYTGWGWVLLSRAAVILLVFFCAAGILRSCGSHPQGDVYRNIVVRYAPELYYGQTMETCAVVRELDLRTEIGNDVLYVFGVGLTEPDEDSGIQLAQVFLCCYDQRWLGTPSQLLGDLTYVPESMEGLGPGDEGWRYIDYPRFPVTPADTYVTIHYDQHGYQAELQVPICWEEYETYEATL